MKQLLTLIISILLLIMVDFSLSLMSSLMDNENYLFGYKKFHEHALETRGQKRIILLGGSSLSWGVSAKDISEKLGILTLNAGIHASVGYRGFYHHAIDVIDKDNDIIIISPEYSIPSNDSVWSRSNEYCEISLFILDKYPLKCIGFSLAKLAKVFPLIHQKNEEYFASGFNNFGDYVFRVEGNNMVGKIEQDYACKGISLDDLVNQYVPFYRDLKDKGFKIFYVPNFTPTSGCSNVQLLDDFHKIMFDEFGIQGFDNIKLQYDEKYFYNTGYHLTYDGVLLKTKIFKNHLQELLTETIHQKQK